MFKGLYKDLVNNMGCGLIILPILSEVSAVVREPSPEQPSEPTMREGGHRKVFLILARKPNSGLVHGVAIA